MEKGEGGGDEEWTVVNHPYIRYIVAYSLVIDPDCDCWEGLGIGTKLKALPLQLLFFWMSSFDSA